MEITKREIIASITIIAIMLLLGILISGKISESTMDSQEKYNKAATIESMSLFKYGMDTNIGNAFIYGEFNTIDPVSFNEIRGKYLSISKVKEVYTRHTRTITKTVNHKRTSHIEYYWTWDKRHSECLKAKNVNFCDINFKYSQFNDLEESYIDTIKESLNVRYKYYGHPPGSKGTAFGNLANGNLANDGNIFYENMTIAETQSHLDSDFKGIVFWVFWIILIGLVVYGFFYLENRWLEN